MAASRGRVYQTRPVEAGPLARVQPTRSLVVSLNSAGQITRAGPPPYSVVINGAMRDEGPPSYSRSEFAEARRSCFRRKAAREQQLATGTDLNG